MGRFYFHKIGKAVTIFGPIRFDSIFSYIEIGDNSWIGREVFFSASVSGKIIIGDNVSIGAFSVLISMERIIIGDYTRIAEFVGIRDHDHAITGTDTKILENAYSIKPVEIGKNVWIGRCVTITKGVTIGDNAVIGANSVVTKDIPAGAIAAGCPATIIRYRSDMA